jgi:hypothetical protein
MIQLAREAQGFMGRLAVAISIVGTVGVSKKALNRLGSDACSLDAMTVGSLIHPIGVGLCWLLLAGKFASPSITMPTEEKQWILKILSDHWHIMYNWNSVFLQFFSWPDAREHHYLWGIESAARCDDFLPSIECTTRYCLNSNSSLPLEQNPGNRRIGNDC